MHKEERAALTQERDAVRQDQGGVDESDNTELTRLDGEIRSLCTHDPINWDSRATDDGRIITTCERCGVSWYEHAG